MMEIDARFEFVGGVLNRLRSELAGAKKAKFVSAKVGEGNMNATGANGKK